MSARTRPWGLVMAGLALGPLAPGPGTAAEDTVMKAMRDEMRRSMSQMRLEELEKPYFISYRVDESTTTTSSASFGSLLSSNQHRSRTIHVEVRVGSHELDNTNFLTFPSFSSIGRVFGGRASLPLEDDYQELRRQIWLTTDAAYKSALETLSQKRAALQNKTRAEETPDFSHEEPVTLDADAALVEVETGAAEEMVRSLSALFREMPDIFTSEVRFHARTERTRFVNSEGSSFTRVQRSVGVTAEASTQAEDGLPLHDFVAAYGSRTEDLPGRKQMEAAIREMGARLARLRTAPLLERYNGPVLFEGQAAAELFAQAFAPGLLAARKPVVGDPRMAGFMAQAGGQSLEDKIGARVLPRFLRVIDDPTLASFDGTVLLGGYPVDDQGVLPAATKLVERGILKTLLADRTPIADVETSTGNRRGGGVTPSNVVVEADGGMSSEEIKQELLLLVEDREAEFGVLVRRLGNPAFKGQSDQMMRMAMMMSRGGGSPRVESPVEAYKVYPDGREELIRNVEFSGISAASFKDIVAASAEPTIYTAPFSSGRSSGPRRIFSFGMNRGSREPLVSWVVPSLLFEDLTLKKPSAEVPNLPVAEHPYFEGRVDP